MIVYLSGPITGTDDYKERFAAAEKTVKERFCKGELSYYIINPAEALIPMEKMGASYEIIMECCLQLLRTADMIYMLKGWEHSKGARMELEAARSDGTMVVYER